MSILFESADVLARIVSFLPALEVLRTEQTPGSVFNVCTASRANCKANPYFWRQVFLHLCTVLPDNCSATDYFNRYRFALRFPIGTPDRLTDSFSECLGNGKTHIWREAHWGWALGVARGVTHPFAFRARGPAVAVNADYGNSMNIGFSFGVAPPNVHHAMQHGVYFNISSATVMVSHKAVHTMMYLPRPTKRKGGGHVVTVEFDPRSLQVYFEVCEVVCTASIGPVIPEPDGDLLAFPFVGMGTTGHLYISACSPYLAAADQQTE
eukprot:TRINITY_DN25293_c0_g1_i1.p1 TRINITY_DN25293_c0_g1~~TRINITY_DN25293_c0_g1_i1.p1  ORF type:complete len:266 (-),score=33.64 TRINITY_DN25293_c0_g1_i1:148-945(-)